MTDIFDSLLVLLPLVAIGHAAYRAFLNPRDVTGIFRRGFLAGGVVLLLLSLVGVVRIFGNGFSADSETLDVAVKAGLGMLIAALICAIVENKQSQHQR
ncbi:hypothetical protein [Planomonospora parontospora]|uniref:hypothetical protein n=1 Tax=Planomonospora parontospora TaxID=58119 RepID=UPI001670239E|nr:hypothetical protein [Planomonospora parontospora]